MTTKKTKPAVSVILVPILPEQGQVEIGPGMASLVKKGLLKTKRTMAKGDRILIPGIALFGEDLPFSVQQTTPEGVVRITEETEITVPTTEGDLEKLGDAASEIADWIDQRSAG
jgi:hypothetical protein